MSDDLDPHAAETHERLERIAHPEPAPPLHPDADGERDVSMLAMVGLLVLIIGIGFAAWGATSPGFFSGGGGTSMSCVSTGEVVPGGAEGPADPPQERTQCRANVNGRIITGSQDEIDALIAQARTDAPVLGAERKFWVGMVLIILGVFLTAWGVIRARRMAG